jgi:1-hydroxycarotenoid 3,4-desaturase
MRRIIVIGAGVGGLTAALCLATRGLAVVVVEQAGTPGGKMREIEVDGRHLDGGPTVLTMKWVLDEIFADAGAALAEHVTLRPLDLLARHAWSPNERLDLFADVGRSADAIGDFAGPAEARRYREFCAWTRQIYQTLETPFLRSPRASLRKLVAAKAAGFARELWPLAPFSTVWRALGRYFHDPRLRQLFGRYATYCGSSPFLAPATLMLIAHVEQCGVWIVDGGMHRLAAALARLATARGAQLRYGVGAAEIVVVDGRVAGVTLSTGERLDADAVIVTADVAAVAAGRLGRPVAGVVSPVRHSQRSLSAMTWAMLAECEGFPLVRHNVFFSRDYAAEFHDLFGRGRLPTAPTVYICAQDRTEPMAVGRDGPERLLCLINAPPIGDMQAIAARELDQCERRTFEQLERCGLHIRWRVATVTTPSDFERMFPATGGALYGRASHGWLASFRRPGSRTRMRGLYLAGGSTHPGAGVPTAALSGRSAAASLLVDLASTGRFGRAAMRGGMSTP